MAARRAPRGARLPLLPILLASLAGCGSLTGPSDADRLEEARARWARTAPASYRFEFTPECFCGGGGVRVQVTVSGGVVTEARYVSTGALVDSPERDQIPTIPDLFDVIADAIDRRAVRIEATYDGTWGFPARVAIDYSANVVDEEYGFTVAAFASLGLLGAPR